MVPHLQHGRPMRSRTLLTSSFLAIASLVVACSGETSNESSSESNVSAASDPYAPYSDTIRDIRVMGRLDPQNVAFANFAAQARDQGKLASCASHGFIGMLENQLWMEKGVTVDLSERYQLYSNYLDTKTMGGMPSV